MSVEIVLRDVIEEDLPVFFEHQIDKEATDMAAFPARDRKAFMQHWHGKVLTNEGISKQTIVFQGVPAGHILCWKESDRHIVGYWLGKEYWGKGIATQALSSFIRILNPRPLFAHVVKHNIASLKVLKKCGFVISSEGIIPTPEAVDEVEEYILKLDL